MSETVAAVLDRHPNIGVALIFGSLARNAANAGSDLDLAVAGRRPLDATEKVRLIEELALATGRPVDLIDLQSS
jgi:predicted nucleotidyltransferase